MWHWLAEFWRAKQHQILPGVGVQNKVQIVAVIND